MFFNAVNAAETEAEVIHVAAEHAPDGAALCPPGQRLHGRGGLPIVQLPSSAESPAMPAAALRQVPEARSLTLHEISDALAALSPSAMRGARS